MKRLELICLGKRKDLLSYWEQTANPEVVIIGAGFTGLWIAYFLAKKHKHHILLIQKDALSLGASTRNAGFLVSGSISEMTKFAKQNSIQQALQLLAARLEGIKIIKKEYPYTTNCKSYDFDEVTEEKITMLELANQKSSQLGLGDIYRVCQQEYGGKKKKAIQNSYDDELNPVLLVNFLRMKLQQMGVKILCAQVTKISPPNLTILMMNQQITFEYKKCFLCVNAFSKTINPKSQIIPGRGQIIVTSKLQKSNKFLGFKNQGFDYWRWIDNRLLIGGGRHTNPKQQQTLQFNVQTDSPIKRYLIDMAKQVLGHDNFKVEYHWAGIMGFMKGKHSRHNIEKIGKDTYQVFGCGGIGVSLSPMLAKIISQKYFEDSN